MSFPGPPLTGQHWLLLSSSPERYCFKNQGMAPGDQHLRLVTVQVDLHVHSSELGIPKAVVAHWKETEIILGIDSSLHYSSYYGKSISYSDPSRDGTNFLNAFSHKLVCRWEIIAQPGLLIGKVREHVKSCLLATYLLLPSIFSLCCRYGFVCHH